MAGEKTGYAMDHRVEINLSDGNTITDILAAASRSRSVVNSAEHYRTDPQYHEEAAEWRNDLEDRFRERGLYTEGPVADAFENLKKIYDGRMDPTGGDGSWQDLGRHEMD